MKGFPSALVDRTEVVDPLKLEMVFLENAALEPYATLAHSAKWNAESRILEVEIETNLQSDTLGELKLVVGLIQDQLSGDGYDWGQVNMYSGGGAGPMNGYELKPGKVPGDEMVYDHVAKYLLTPF